MVDVFGNDLNINDKVMVNCGAYKNNIVLGTIVGFTPKMVKVSKTNPYFKGKPEQVISNYNKVVLVSKLSISAEVLDEMLIATNILTSEKR